MATGPVAANGKPNRYKRPPDQDEIVEEAKRIFEPAAVDGVYTHANGQPLELYARLAKIMASLPEVKPEGNNAFFKYKFVTDKQVLGLVRPRLAQQMIVVYPETVTEQEPIERQTAKEGRSLLTRLHVVFRVVDGINGDTFTGEAVGYGDDSGDKGANKAYTAALKNFFIKLFLMGGADRDIEEDEDTDRRARAREVGVAPVTSVEVKETVVEGVARGGRSQKATEAQVMAISRLVRELSYSPQDLARAIDNSIGFPVEFTSWDPVRPFLGNLSGEDIGQLISDLSAIIATHDEMVADAAGPLGDES